MQPPMQLSIRAWLGLLMQAVLVSEGPVAIDRGGHRPVSLCDSAPQSTRAHPHLYTRVAEVDMCVTGPCTPLHTAVTATAVQKV